MLGVALELVELARRPSESRREFEKRTIEAVAARVLVVHRSSGHDGREMKYGGCCGVEVLMRNVPFRCLFC